MNFCGQQMKLFAKLLIVIIFQLTFIFILKIKSSVN